MDIDLGDGCNTIMLILYGLTKLWGWNILGILLVIGGFIYGFTSHQVSYAAIDKASLTPYFIKGGTDYFQEKGGSTYYILNENDFSPAFKRGDFFDSEGFTFIIRTDAENVDVTLSDNTQLTGSGYQIEEITFFYNNGQDQQVFRTSEYAQHPQGFYEDHWTIGKTLIYIGFPLSIITLCIALIVSRKRSRI